MKLLKFLSYFATVVAVDVCVIGAFDLSKK